MPGTIWSPHDELSRMSVVPHRIASSSGMPRSRTLKRLVRRVSVLLLLAACAACFAIGRARRASERREPPRWAPAQALPSATIEADAGAPASIPDLSFSAPKAAARGRHGHAATVASPSGTARPAAATPVLDTAGSSLAAGQTSATEPTTPSTQAAPVSTSHTVSPTAAPAPSGAKRAAPASSRTKAGQGSSSGSFDSSG